MRLYRNIYTYYSLETKIITRNRLLLFEMTSKHYARSSFPLEGNCLGWYFMEQHVVWRPFTVTRAYDGRANTATNL